MRESLSSIRQRTWDFWLTIGTVVLLGGLGIQSFLGTAYSWWAQRTIASWEQAGYANYVAWMNAIAAPQIVALVVVMGLCVPKRLFSRRTLVAVSAVMLALGAAVWALSGNVAAGLGAYLALAALIQVAVVVLTIAGTRSLTYLTEGRLTKIGSGLLHLGFIGICFVIAELQRSRFMMPAFWIATATILVGTALSFWASRIAYRRPDQDEEPAEEPRSVPDLEVSDHSGDEGRSEFDELG